MDNNSKSDRRTSELWRFSRTTESGGHYEESGLEKKDEDIIVGMRELWQPEIFALANFCTAEFRAKYANALKWDTRKNALRTMCNFSHFALLLCVFVLLILPSHVKSAIRESIPHGKKMTHDKCALLAILSHLKCWIYVAWEGKSLMRISISRATHRNSSLSILKN